MKKTRLSTSCLVAALCLATTTLHAEHIHNRADSHGPIGVMGEHMMEAGEWMTSYRFMNMHMQGMRTGTHDLSPEQLAVTANPLAGETMRMGYNTDGSPRIMTIPGDYRVVPLEMDMNMHMFGLMYGFSDDLTAMIMLNYVEKEMTSRTYRGPAGATVVGDFTGKTSGLGDTVVSAMIRLDDSGHSHWHANLGLSLPTGSITEAGSVLPPFSGMMGTAPGEKVSIDRLGYPMQLGSGTVDFLPGLTFTQQRHGFSWGAKAAATLRLYDNRENYRLGNRYQLDTWASRLWQPWLSTSVRLSLFSQGSIKGRDKVITGGNPVFDPANSGRDQIDLSVGVNLLGLDGWRKNQRLALEVGMPVYEKVDGIQMSSDMTITLGWKTTF